MVLRRMFVAMSLLFVAGQSPADAASVSWGPAFELVTVDDLDFSAPHILAANGGNDIGVEVGGVTFDNYVSPNFTSVTGEPSWVTTDSGDGDYFSFSTAGVDVYGASTGDDGLDTILATHMYGDVPLTQLTHTLHGLTIGEAYKIQIVGQADDRGVCCDDFVTHVDGGDGQGGVTIHRLFDVDADTVKHVTMAVGTFTADATTQQFTTIGQSSDGTPSGANQGLAGFSALLVSSDTPLGAANVVANVDRSTGEITLTNTSTIGTANVLAYSLTSNVGAFDQTQWKSIAANYDADGPNIADSGALLGSVDADDKWTIFSATDDDTDLSEGEFAAGDGGAIAPGQTVNLGAVWRRTPFEDVAAELLLDDGTIRTISVTYSGGEIMAGDLDGNGVINSIDWEAFKSGQGTNFATVSPALAYQMGNLKADNFHDLYDFALFEAAYDTANGPGAFARMVAGVPEPSSSILLMLAAVGSYWGVGRCRVRRGALLLAVVAGLAWLPSMSKAVSVNWGPAFELISVDDLDFTGSNILAVNGGNDAGLVIGGVTFDNYASPDFGAITNEPAWITTTASGGDFLSFAQSTADVYATTTENAELDTLLGAHTYANPPLTSLTHSISGLTVGKSYQIQVIGQADDRGVCCDDFVTNIDGGELAGGTTIHRFVDLDNDSVKHVSTAFGTFTADATTVEFTTIGQTSDGTPGGVNQGHGGFAGLILSEIEAPKVFRMGIEVNTSTGRIQLINNTDAAVDFDSYQIRSAGEAPSYTGSLNETGWSSISERETPIAGFPQGGGSGDGWEVGPVTGANELIEWYLDDEGNESSLASGASIDLGTAYDTSVDGQDLEFLYKRPDGSIVFGLVNYISTPGLAGDYNGDNVVNIADYTVWRNTLGSTTDLRADGSGDSAVGPEDYAIWKSHFGQSAGLLSATISPAAVPEPRAWALAMLGLACFISRTWGGWSSRFRTVPAWRQALVRASGVLIVAWATVGSTAQAMVTNDREYLFGEDALEGASQGANLGSSNSGALEAGYTADSKGPSMAYLDLSQSGDPTYEDVGPGGLARPGVAGTEYGARFDGEDSLLTGTPLNRPDELALLIQPTVYPIDYTGITSRGMQMWVYPDADALGSGSQTIVFDTQVMGGPQISADGKWTQANSQHTADNFNGFGAIPGDVDVQGDTWQHVMQHVYNKSDLRAPKILSGTGTLNHIAIVYADGVAVSANADNMPAGFDLMAQGFSGDLIVGAEDNGEGGYKNHFAGVIDNLEMYVFGDNETGSPGVLTDGENWGTFDLFADNDWIAMEIASTVPGGILQPGDVNKDGAVDELDVDAFVLGWKYENVMIGAHSTMTVGDWNTWDQGDMNHDGVTNLADAFILHQALVASTGVGLDFGLLADSPVPEPGSVVLMLSGTLAIVFARVRRGASARG